MTLPGYLAGVLLSSLYGAGFHVLFGGGGRRLFLYLTSGWLGFALGHMVGNRLSVEVLMLGALNVLTGTLGSWLALLLARWLVTSSDS